MDAKLALEDGRVFHGKGLGARGQVTGEVVFNTGMTGYQEIMTDPSYRGQIVTLTVPHVGNTGINDADPESAGPQLAGLVIRCGSRVSSSWRAQSDLEHYMRAHGVVGIEGIDTRALTRHLRDRGVVRGCLATGAVPDDEAVAAARRAPKIEEQDLVAQVTCPEPYAWRETCGGLLGPLPEPRGHGLSVAAIDYGVKRNILRLLASQGFELTVVPAGSSPRDVLGREPDGVFLSNGPGDPATMDAAVETIRGLVGRVPIFGICLGHQLLARALGASTFKLKFGHRGINHPVREAWSGTVAITSQNHGYAVDPKSLPGDVIVTHTSLYDGTVEGLAHAELPLFCVQFHPEAAPGPHDTWDLFGRFVTMIRDGRPVPAPARRRSA